MPMDKTPAPPHETSAGGSSPSPNQSQPGKRPRGRPPKLPPGSTSKRPSGRSRQPSSVSAPRPPLDTAIPAPGELARQSHLPNPEISTVAEVARLLIYGDGLTSEEAGLFQLIKDASPGEEIALLRIFIRRMLSLVLEAQSLKEMFQTMNALGYIAGRLARLFEVQIALDRSSSAEDDDKAYSEAINRLIERFRESSRPP
jgi:hypothetical protein